MKFNITAGEFKKAYEYAKENGSTEFKTITMTNIPGEIGNAILISNDWDDEEPEDITDYSSW